MNYLFILLSILFIIDDAFTYKLFSGIKFRGDSSKKYGPDSSSKSDVETPNKVKGFPVDYFLLFSDSNDPSKFTQNKNYLQNINSIQEKNSFTETKQINPENSVKKSMVPDLGAWRTILTDDTPPTLVEYLDGSKILPSFHDAKIMEMWEEIKKRRSIRSFNIKESSQVLDALKIAYVAFYGKKSTAMLELSIEKAIGTGMIISELKGESVVVIGGILHDIFQSIPNEESTLVKLLLISRIGAESVALIEKYMKLPKLMTKTTNYTPIQSEYHVQLLVATAEDYRALYIRLAERLHTMRVLKSLKIESSEKIKIAREVRMVYAPLAHKMGIMKVKGELEDLAFRVIDPEMFQLSRYTQIAANKAFQEATEQIKLLVENDLIMKKHNATYRLTYRIKDKYQLYLKMQRKSLNSPSEVRDALGLRIILMYPRREEESDESYISRGNELCYHLVNRFRTMKGWLPAINGLKDYILDKKDNGYQSIHQYIKNIALSTNVEIQVRTLSMHMTAELGNAAHWYYKDSIYNPSVAHSIPYKLAWRSKEQLNCKSPAELFGLAKKQITSSRVLVFLEDTSSVLNLKKGSNLLDAGYTIGSQLGMPFSAVKNKSRNLDIAGSLENGDTITLDSSSKGLFLYLSKAYSKNSLFNFYDEYLYQ